MTRRMLAALFVSLSLASADMALAREEEPQCSLHRVTVKAQTVPIRYGKPRLDPVYQEAKKAAFPNARSADLAGCLMFKGAPRKTKVYVCPVCDEARVAWRKDHPDIVDSTMIDR